jgi:hypothetical protein
MSSLTHREKLLYGELAGILIGISFFLALSRRSLSDPHLVIHAIWISWLFTWQVPLWHKVYYLHSTDTVDERDRLIELRGIHAGYNVLCLGLLAILYILFPASGSSAFPTGHILSGVFAAWLLSRIAKVVRQLELYHTEYGLLSDYLKRRMLARRQRRQRWTTQ